jgi:hypothetical protein
MTLLLSFLLLVSLIVNGVLLWYVRKLIENLNYGIKNVDELQKFLDEYVSLLEPLAQLENYYGEPAIDSAIANTKLAIQACKGYKNSIIESQDEENKENETSEEAKKQEVAPQRTATIGPISS